MKKPSPKWRLLLAGLLLVLVTVILVAGASTKARKPSTGPRATAQAPSAPHVIFVVSNTADSGAGSLRNAIDQANTSPGLDAINFDIGTGTPTINVGGGTSTPLPAIMDPVTINGATGGATRIELNGTGAGASANGLSLMASNCTVAGLVINRFSGHGVALIQGSNNTISGNLIGTNAAGSGASPNLNSGVFIEMTSVGNNIGSASGGNVISGNGGNGISLNSTSNNKIIGNLIGTDINGTAPVGNSGAGITGFSGTSNNRIGGTAAGEGNIIAFNGADGIFLAGGSGNAILENSMFGNGTFGIGLNDDGGITVNDPCDIDGGANLSQNFPDLTSAQNAGGMTAITGNLNSAQNTTFRIEFFSNSGCNSTGNGEGEMFIGSTNVTTPGAGCDAPISVTLPVAVAVGNVITATATDPSNNTSEFSHCVAVTAAACVVTCPANFSRTNDPNQCGAVITYPPPTTSGACGSVNCSPSSGSFFPVGMTLVTCTSAAGPSCTFTVTVTDTQAPTITCPANISQPAPVGSCSAVVTYPDAPASDNCPALSAPMCTPPSGSTFQGGVTTVTCTVVDASGLSGSCSFTITVTDTQPPTITCPANITQGTAANQCSAVVTYPAPAVGDNCPGVGAPVCNPPSGSTFNKGVTAVTCGVSDSSSNTANCGFTVTINDTTPPTITCPPSQSVISGVPTVVNYPAPTAGDNCPGVTSACAPPSGSLFAPGATTVTCTATDTSANNTSCTFTVNVGPCTITCPKDVVAHIGASATACATNVSYPPAEVVGGCGPATCTPASGSLFAVGSTIVTCTISGGLNCSFVITVVDDAAPRIACPNNIVTATTPGQSSAVVNYPAATATDNCPGASVQCSPPAGSRFPIGTTFVNCTAVDASSNSAACVFSVIVVDTESPVITCPANVAVGTQAGQTSAIVSYPPPNVNDNSAVVGCSPASGSSFPLGVTTVTCTATDVAGNKSTCSFIVSVGGPLAKVIIPSNKAAVEFGASSPVAPARKPPKPKKNPCGLFSIQNIGFAPLVLTLDSITRTGSDVDSKRIADANDTKYFSLSFTALDQLPGTIEIGGVLTIPAGGTQLFCLRFSALIPALAGKATGLAAADALPDTVTSIVTFRQNAGSTLSVSVLSHLATGVIFINPTNPRQPPSISFTRSGNDITVSYALYDPNQDVRSAKYEFLGSGGQVIGSAFETDLAEQLRALGLVRGQSFSVEQRFTGASDHPEIVGVRVTVFDGETSVTDSATAASSVTSSSIRLLNRNGDAKLYGPGVQLTAPLP